MKAIKSLIKLLHEPALFYNQFEDVLDDQDMLDDLVEHVYELLHTMSQIPLSDALLSLFDTCIDRVIVSLRQQSRPPVLNLEQFKILLNDGNLEQSLLVVYFVMRFDYRAFVDKLLDWETTGGSRVKSSDDAKLSRVIPFGYKFLAHVKVSSLSEVRLPNCPLFSGRFSLLCAFYFHLDCLLHAPVSVIDQSIISSSKSLNQHDDQDNDTKMGNNDGNIQMDCQQLLDMLKLSVQSEMYLNLDLIDQWLRLKRCSPLRFLADTWSVLSLRKFDYEQLLDNFDQIFSHKAIIYRDIGMFEIFAAILMNAVENLRVHLIMKIGTMFEHQNNKQQVDRVIDSVCQSLVGIRASCIRTLLQIFSELNLRYSAHLKCLGQVIDALMENNNAVLIRVLNQKQLTETEILLLAVCCPTLVTLDLGQLLTSPQVQVRLNSFLLVSYLFRIHNSEALIKLVQDVLLKKITKMINYLELRPYQYRQKFYDDSAVPQNLYFVDDLGIIVVVLNELCQFKPDLFGNVALKLLLQIQRIVKPLEERVLGILDNVQKSQSVRHALHTQVLAVSKQLITGPLASSIQQASQQNRLN
ncbi:hypothetical protein MP228_005232 [Amoeboaphelidium protococcarum]|nr:hypothetical protein MP228_005232 [Amoeboaphelidium protococcarum]